MKLTFREAIRLYANVLEREKPSNDLDARVARSIDAWSAPGQRRRSEAAFETKLFAAAAAVALFVIGAAYVAVTRGPPPQAEPVALESAGAREATPLLAAPVRYAASEVPVDAVVLRVPTSAASAVVPAVVFWVDVRIASDGSMRVVRVVPVEP